MSIHFSGTFNRSGGLMSAIVKQIKLVNLTPVNKIDVRFDPFDDRTKPTRDFLFYISSPKVRATNLQCSLKTEVVCDRSEPTVTFSLQSGEKVVLKTALLSSLNILELYNKHITSLIPPDPAKLQAKKEEEEERKKKRWRPHHRIKLWSKRRGVFHNMYGEEDNVNMASRTGNSKDYNLRLIDMLYSHVPAFTDVFDEESWYVFVICFVAGTFLVAFILSRFITIKPVE